MAMHKNQQVALHGIMARQRSRSSRHQATPNDSTEPSGDVGTDAAWKAKLWKAANMLRGSMDAAEYKHVVLGLLFLKYVSDAFMEAHAKIGAELYANPEDRDEYASEHVFWVPEKARWSNVMKQARQPDIGQVIDEAMDAIERENKTLRDVLPKTYARLELDKTRLGQIIDLVSNIQVGDEESRSKDVLGRVYEYFLAEFASAEGKKGGEFYTPNSVVRLLVEMLEPYSGRVYDPCCGSAGMFVQSKRFIDAHRTGNGNGGRAKAPIRIFGQESNHTTWRLAKMNLAIRGIEGRVEKGDSFHNDKHPDLKADFILANPHFNDSEWEGDLLRENERWQYGIPPVSNANFAWVQHIIHHLAPSGTAGFVLANGSMSSNQSGEGDIRRNILEADLVDCMVALPGQLFYSTQIPACLWFVSRNRQGGKYRDRRGEVLFIDARRMGLMVDRRHRILSKDDIDRIADAYHAWRGGREAGEYADMRGFCKSVKLEEIRKHDHVLTPSRYIETELPPDDDEPFEEKIIRLASQWRVQQAEAVKLDLIIEESIEKVGF